MELGGGQEGEVVSTVGDGGADQSHAVPHGCGGHMGAQEDRPESHRQHVGDLTEEEGQTAFNGRGITSKYSENF